MDKRKIGKILIIISLVLYLFLFVYLELGQKEELVYRYTGNTSFSGKYIELQKIDTNQIEYFPAGMFPENIAQGDIIEIDIRYSIDNPQGVIENVKIIEL
ncbi:MAG: hypothetical protein QG646_2625 [Euryarchaeota archaeon]|nr:hypothetical protein [Euryarchaeota archaeon]